MQIEKLKNDPKASMVVVSPFEMAIIDLLNMRVHYWDTEQIEKLSGFNGNKMLKLVRCPAGSRRERPRDSRKQSDQEFQLRDGEFAKDWGEFAILYSTEKLGEK